MRVYKYIFVFFLQGCNSGIKVATYIFCTFRLIQQMLTFCTVIISYM